MFSGSLAHPRSISRPSPSSILRGQSARVVHHAAKAFDLGADVAGQRPALGRREGALDRHLFAEQRAVAIDLFLAAQERMTGPELIEAYPDIGLDDGTVIHCDANGIQVIRTASPKSVMVINE